MRQTRLQTMEQAGHDIQLPALGVARHLVAHLLDAGPIVLNANGSAPLSWTDIDAWARITGVRLQTWEARGLRRLSLEYMTCAQRAQEPNCPPPYNQEPEPDKRERIGSELRSIFSTMKGAKK